MSILLNYFKQLNNRKIVYTLYLLKLINPQIIIQADQEYLISKLKELNLNSDELETIKNTIDNFLINDEIVYGDGSLSYKIFCSLMFLKFYCPYTHSIPRNPLINFFDDIVLSNDVCFFINQIQPVSNTSHLSLQNNNPQNLSIYQSFASPNPSGNSEVIQGQQPPFQPVHPYPYQPIQQPPFQPVHPYPYQPIQQFPYEPVQQPPYQPVQQFPYEPVQQPPYQPVQQFPYEPVRQPSPLILNVEGVKEMPENRFTAIYNELKQYTQLNSKITMYTNTRQSYISTRNILSYFDWFKSSNESQLIWALEYLDKMKIPVYPRLFLPNSNQEIYDAIVVSITFMGFENAMTFSRINVENFIKKMRQAWYQKRYRDNKDGESALQYLLSKSYLKKLDKLSEIYGVPPLEVLQSLIAQEYDKR